MSRTATKSKILATIAVVVILIGAGWALIYNKNQRSNQSPANQNSSQEEVSNNQNVVIEADKISYPGEAGQTALSLLQKHTQTKTENSSFGEYVVSINDNDGGGSKYWIFYVNDKQSEVGAGSYVTSDTDSIEWRLE
jgi:hypothetical protein